jgi:hypothetical protein
MNFKTMSKQRKFILIAAGIGFIAMFLPWVQISLFGMNNSLNGMHDKGILVFLCFVVAGVLAYVGDQTKNLGKTNWFIILVAGALATLITGSLLGFGFYLAGLAAIGVLVATYLFRSPGDSIKGGFDNLKDSIDSKAKSSSTP